MPVVASMTLGDRVSALVADRRRAESIGIAAILLVAGAATLIVAARTGQLTWDEVVYASQAQSLVSDIPSVYWGSYRPPGLPLLGTLAAIGGFSEISLRAITWALGLVALAITWAVARQLWGRWAALFTLLAAIGSPVVLGELRQFHNDLASSGLLILLMGLLWDQFERRPAPTRLLLAAAPVAAAAFYLRYGTVLALASIGVVAVVLWAPSLRRQARLVAVTAALGALLLVPHVLEAIRVTGSPTGMLTQGAAAATKGNPILTLVGFARRLPLAIAGPVATIVLAFGVGHAVVAGRDAWRRRGWTADVRRQTWTLLTALLAVLGTAAVGNPNPRYLVFPLLLGLISGGGALAWAARAVGRSGPPWIRRNLARPGALAVVAILLAAWTGLALTRSVVSVVRRDPPAARSIAGAAIRADAGGPCYLASTSPPTFGWYSGCAVDPLDRARPLLTGDSTEPGTAYVVFLPGDDTRADPKLVARFRDMVQAGGWTLIESGSSGIEIYRRDSAAQVPQANAK
jgi:dolichyl-phosphate-mannose-protein mannosyltransferase